MRMVVDIVLLLQQPRPFIGLLLSVGLLFGRWTRTEVKQRQRRDPDSRTMMMAEHQMVMMCRSIRMIAVMESTTGESISLAAFFGAVKTCLLDGERKEKSVSLSSASPLHLPSRLQVFTALTLSL
jgi:hypothetical protein